MPKSQKFVSNDVITAAIAFGCGVLLAFVASVGSSGRPLMADSRGLGPMAHFPALSSLCRGTALDTNIAELARNCERKTQ
jgi:hypothetical protein